MLVNCVLHTPHLCGHWMPKMCFSMECITALSTGWVKANLISQAHLSGAISPDLCSGRYVISGSIEWKRWKQRGFLFIHYIVALFTLEIGASTASDCTMQATQHSGSAQANFLNSLCNNCHLTTTQRRPSVQRSVSRYCAITISMLSVDCSRRSTACNPIKGFQYITASVSECLS